MSHGRRLSVTGLGYVGLSAAVAFARSGTPVVAFDIDIARIDELRRGIDRSGEVAADNLVRPGLDYTADSDRLAAADFHIIAVPTPITAARKPDLGPLLKATETIGRILKAGDIVVFESTVYPGATEEDCIPLLEAESGLVCGRDFDVGYSPERINPGDRCHRFETIRKVVSAQNQRTLGVLQAVYGSVVTAGVYATPDIRTAEAAKAIENTQRDLNIALMNELAMICARLGIDTRDVLAAAGTKWNFLSFFPGLVGGHCVGVDPYYLTDRAERAGYHPQVILAGRRINDGMGQWIAQETIKRLLRESEGGHGDGPLRIAVLGITFKEDVSDIRNTRVADLVHELASFGAIVEVTDPLADAREVEDKLGISLMPIESIREVDGVIVAVPHRPYREGGWSLITPMVANARCLVVDVRGILERRECPAAIRLWRL